METVRRGLATGNGVLLSLPDRLVEKELITQLARIGYKSRPLPGRSDRWVFVDTHDGAVYAKGLMLYRSMRVDSWHYGSTTERTQTSKRVQRKVVDYLLNLRPSIPLLEATIRERRWRLRSASAHAFTLSFMEWGFRNPLGGGSEGHLRFLSLKGEHGRSVDQEDLLAVLREAVGCREFRGDLLEAGLNTANLPLPGAPYPNELRIELTDTPRSGCRKIVDGQRYKLKANLRGALLDIDPGSVRDASVACRRLRFALKLFSDFLPSDTRKQAQRRLSAVADLLKAVRDLDVLCARLPDQLDAVEAPWEFREKITATYAGKRRRALLRSRSELNVAEIECFLDSLVASLGLDHGSTGSPRIVPFAEQQIARAFKRVTKWDSTRSARYSETDLHELRILCKKLRYTCEFFLPLGGEPLSRAVKTCVSLLDCVGALNDAAAMADALATLSERAKFSKDHLLLGALIQVQRGIRRDQEAAFEGLWTDFKRVARQWKRERSRPSDSEDVPSSIGPIV